MEEVKIQIPEDWSEVPLTKYQKFYLAVKPYQGVEEFFEKLVEIAIYHLCNLDSDTLRKLPVESFTEVHKEVIKLLGRSDKMPLVKSFELDGIKYGFIPDLQNMSYGEYVDLVTYSKDVYENAAIFCSILYRPVTKEDKKGRYIIEPYKGTDEDTVELFQEKLTMDIVFGAIGFFLHLQQDLQTVILDYSIQTLKNLTPEESIVVQETLQKNGASTKQLLQLLEEISQNLKQ